MLTELRFSARRLRADTWTTLTAIVTVALGAGLTIAVFTVSYGLLLRPLPYDLAGRLWLVDVRMPAGQIDDWRRHLSSFERLTAYAAEGLVVSGAGDPRLVRGAYVDAWFFQTVTAEPVAGRVPSHDEDASVAVSERFAGQLGGAPEALLGQQLMAGGASLTVVGVMPGTFAFPAGAVEIWIPARQARPIAFDRSPDARQFRVAGWLRPGVSPESASEEVERVQRLLQPDARARDQSTPVLESAHAAVTRGIRGAVVVFAGATALVWIVTCANLATILVGRTITRRRELAVCHALGAGGWRRPASVLSECLLVTAAGTCLGIVLAMVVTRGVAVWAHEFIARPGEIRLDAAAMVFAIAGSVLMAVVATILALPALRRSTSGLYGPHAGATAHDRRLRGGLLVAQMTLVVVLVTGGALLLRTHVSLLGTDLGLDRRGAIVSQLVLTPASAFEAPDRWPLLRELLERIRVLPGVRFAGAGSSLPPDNAQVEISVRLTGPQGEERHTFSAAVVTPGYLEAIGARLLDGRFFEPSDLDAGSAVILSESAARALMGGPAVAGRELPFSVPGVRDRRRPTVVGVIGDIRYSGLEAQPDSAVYVPWNQAPLGQGFLAVRTAGVSSAASIAAIRASMRELDPAMPHLPMRTFDEVVERSIGIRRVAALLGTTLALLAFGVALVGLAGSVLRAVEERRRELAIRCALGAAPRHVVQLIASQVLVVSVVGLVLGMAGGVATARVLRALVPGVGPYDARTLITVAGFVMAASLLASYLPARRAAGIDPAQVLKAE